LAVHPEAEPGGPRRGCPRYHVLFDGEVLGTERLQIEDRGSPISFDRGEGLGLVHPERIGSVGKRSGLDFFEHLELNHFFDDEPEVDRRGGGHRDEQLPVLARLPVEDSINEEVSDIRRF